jgi:hypothetical protein
MLREMKGGIMTTATKSRPRKTSGATRDRALHVVFEVLENAGERLTSFAKSADSKLTKHARKQAPKSKTA